MRLPVITLLLSPHSLIVVGCCIMGKIGKNATSGLKNIEIGKFLIVILSQKIISPVRKSGWPSGLRRQTQEVYSSLL